MHRATTLPVSEQTCSPEHCAILFVSLELSRSTWVATTLAPGSTKMSKHTLVGGDGRKLLDLLARLKTRAEQRISAPVKVVAIHEVGLDGFWIHRLLKANGIESHVVDPASIAVPRRHRRAKTDAIDGETLLRTLMAWQRGEPRVCAMTVPPSPSEEDHRRITRERAKLLQERIRHTNRIRGLLFGQGITNYNPLHKLGENDRLATGYLPRLEFEAAVDEFFARPQTSVRGWEPAAEAQARIVRAVEQILSQTSAEGDLAIVGHGGTGTLLYCHLAGLPIDRRYDQPATNGGNWFAFDRASRKLLHQGWRSIDGADR